MKLFNILVIVLVLGGVYYFFFYETSSTNVTSLNISEISVGAETLTEGGTSYSGLNRVINLTGGIEVDGDLNQTVYLVINDVKQNVEISDGMINTQAILESGTNTVQLIVEDEDGDVVFSSDEWVITAGNLQTTKLMTVLSWNTDHDDVDMSIIGPNGSEAYFYCMNYSCNGIGNQDLDDVNGYGPETFVLHPDAPSGLYQIRANYYMDYGNITSPLVTMVVKTSSGTNTYTHTFSSMDANYREGPYWNPVNVTIN